ncbi:hypothetical protein SteCoe_8795 [Stentor coeruleus]|uniref:Uncharacterized protein n=1 Tax=Stentor coeruleus TaxID=5963 RepID=A0A1R2CJE9_9CILI|nr:hypothetical protein SteCoe_8795 [Stentor coeruleus]
MAESLIHINEFSTLSEILKDSETSWQPEVEDIIDLSKYLENSNFLDETIQKCTDSDFFSSDENISKEQALKEIQNLIKVAELLQKQADNQNLLISRVDCTDEICERIGKKLEQFCHIKRMKLKKTESNTCQIY